MDAYRQVARQLLSGEIVPADLPIALSTLPDLNGSDILALSAQALERSHSVPREGWSQARVAQAAAQRLGDAQLVSNISLDLIESQILAEHYREALGSLDALQPALLEAHSAILTGRCEWLRGVAQSRMARAGEAAQSLATAGPYLRQAGSPNEVMRWQCDLARVKMLQADYDSALELAQASREYFLEQPHAASYVGQCEWVLAAINYSQGQYALALRWLTSSIAQFKTIGWLAEEMRSQMLMAQTLERQLAYSDAVALCQQIHPTLERLDLPATIARCDNTLGLALLGQGDPTTAMTCFEHARRGFTKVGILAFAADSELSLGRIFYDQGDYHAAIAQYQRASELYRQHGHPAQVGHCEHNIGRCYREMGNYSQALNCFAGAKAVFARLGRQADLAICLHNLAFTYWLMGDWTLAADFFGQAMTLYQELELPLMVAECQTELAHVTAGRGDVNLALSQVDRARQACAQARYEPGAAICDWVTGNVLNGAGQYADSIGFYQKAARTFVQYGRRLDVVLCDMGLASDHLALGDLAQAEAHLDRASSLADERIPDVAWQVQSLRAQLAQARGQEEDALQAALRAVRYLADTRSSLADESLVNFFLNSSPLSARSRSHVYDQAISLAMRCSRPHETLQIIEERRSQLIASQLRWPAQTARPDSPRLQELFRRRQRLQAQITNLRGELQPGFAGTSGESQDDQAALAQLRDLAKDYQETVVEIRNAGWPAIKSPRDAPPFSLDRFRQSMDTVARGRGWTCLSYSWLDDQLLIAHLNERGKLELTSPALNQLDRMALRALSQPEPSWREALYLASSDRSGYSRAGETFRCRLYDVLIPPSARDELDPNRLLLVVPSGNLHNIPFAALQTSDTFLAQQSLLVTSPSLLALTLLSAQFGTRTGRDQLLIVAADRFDAPIAALPFVKEETATVLSAWHGEADVLQGDGATLAALRRLNEKDKLSSYRVIHLATHAVFGGELGRLSRLMLKDGDLFVDDIRALHLDAELIVLSACQTGLGEIYTGDEIVGLAYGFLAAGARAVIASLWHVNDPAASSLMSHFYRELNQTHHSAKALAQAQRKAIADGWPPYLWAAFSNIGLP